MSKNTTVRKHLDEDEDFVSSGSVLGYSVESQVANQYTVYLTQDFVEPNYYTNVLNMMLKATELDHITFFVCSPGGRADGLVVLLEGLKNTEAHTQAVLVGDAHSAASIFALHCDSVHVGDHASMLCHNVSYGAVGKGADVAAKVAHTTKTSEKLLRSAYTHFLTEEEIKDMLKGTEIWLDCDEILVRLKNKAAALALKNSELSVSEPEVQKPARKTKEK